MPLSGLFMALGLFWGLFTRYVLDELADVSTMLIVMTGVQIGVIGLLAELVNRRLPNHFREDD
jgi:hypothetical protein